MRDSKRGLYHIVLSKLKGYLVCFLVEVRRKLVVLTRPCLQEVGRLVVDLLAVAAVVLCVVHGAPF
jgi:hypothetical protein